jgi:hypothetical protein
MKALKMSKITERQGAKANNLANAQTSLVEVVTIELVG